MVVSAYCCIQLPAVSFLRTFHSRHSRVREAGRSVQGSDLVIFRENLPKKQRQKIRAGYGRHWLLRFGHSTVCFGCLYGLCSTRDCADTCICKYTFITTELESMLSRVSNKYTCTPHQNIQAPLPENTIAPMRCSRKRKPVIFRYRELPCP